MIKYTYSEVKTVISNFCLIFRYSTDKGFILQINEIRERRKGAAKVNGELWNVSVGKRNLLTFSGAYSQSNVLIHFNCIYFLRVKYVQALSI